MAATTNAAGPHELWIAPADGSGATLLELGPLVPWDAQWDPLRPNVLLVRAEDTRTNLVDLYFVDLQGTILSKLGLAGEMIYGAEWEFAGLAISPDGQTIAYNSVENEGSTGKQHFWAHLVDRDGKNDRLVRLPENAPPLYSQAWSIFSPDGQWIAMESWVTQPDDSAINQIALARTDGSVPTRWLGPSLPNVSLVKTWAPDGTKLLVHANGIDDVYAMDPVTGSYELLPWKSDFPNWQRVAN